MKISNIQHAEFLISLPIIGLLFFLFFSQSPKAKYIVEEKQRGAHVFGLRDTSIYTYLHQQNIEWVTLVSWADQEYIDSPDLNHHYGDSMDILRSDSNLINRMKLARNAGFKVFLKPHVWITEPADGKWRSDIFPKNEVDWLEWQHNYLDFIIRYAKLAEQAETELFCVGTEFTRLAIEMPDFWKMVIQEVRKVYSGKLTYAANWYREYEQLTFWEELDYIGIQAYFPLTENKHPSVQQIEEGWMEYIPKLEAVAQQFERPILFTELGYKSTSNSAIEPWIWLEHMEDQDSLICLETQANCYEAFFNTVWKQDWFAGVHLWQLRGGYKNRNRKNLNFTPQGKPAEKIILKGFEPTN